MCAIHPKADIRINRDVCLVPKADMQGLTDGTAGGPCSRRQTNAAISSYRQIGTYPIAQCSTQDVRERHAVTRCRRLAAKKWRPVIVKVLKGRNDVDWLDCHIR